MRLTLCSATVLVAILATGPGARAQVTFEGSTTGYFNSGAATAGGLSFTGTGFGPFELWNPGDVQGVQFGTLNLDRSVSYQYTDDVFSLFIHFVQPHGGQSVFSAALTGRVNRNTNGTPSVHFSPSQVLTFGETQFQVDVTSPVNFNQRSTREAIGGTITLLRAPPATGIVEEPGVVVTPEPAGVLALAIGLAGLGAVGRRRRRRRTETV